jgi:multicomponent Na+:H+ antiporter subunit C
MITVDVAMAVTIAVLYAVGFYLVLQRSLMRVLIGVVVLGHASNLLLQIAGAAGTADGVAGVRSR